MCMRMCMCECVCVNVYVGVGVTSRLALYKSALSNTQLVRLDLEKLQNRRLAHLKLMLRRSRLDKSTDSKLMP